MNSSRRLSLILLLVTVTCVRVGRSETPQTAVKEEVLEGTNGVQIKLRMEGPYTADVPLQIVCYFKYSPEGERRMKGAPVELDKDLGGVIGALRQRGEFVGDECETLLIVPPQNAIPAKALLLVGLGDESKLSLDVMERVGKVSLREAAALGNDRVAFAPLIRDQGNAKLDTGDVERAVIRGMLLAYDTHSRLAHEGLTEAYTLKEWIVEAGPTYYEDTKTGVLKGIEDAKSIAAKRSNQPHAVAK